jgi:hypothetical protein
VANTPKKKAAPKKPKAPSNHEVNVVEYKSTMMMRTLYEPTCSCGWNDVRCLTKAQARAISEKHLNNPIS